MEPLLMLRYAAILSILAIAAPAAVAFFQHVSLYEILVVLAGFIVAFNA